MKLSTTQEREKEAILAGDFQHYPILPMKRWVNGDMECGVMMAPHYNMLLIANMWFLSNPNYIRQAKVMMYTDLDELLLDGWQGD